MKAIKLLFALLLMSLSLFAQKQILVQKNDGRTVLSLLLNNQMVSTIPASFPRLTTESFEVNDQCDLLKTFQFNWTLKFSAPGKVFKDISFTNAQVGYIVTELGSVYKTENGGDNWISVMNLGFPYYWYGVYALSPDTVVISGFNNQGQISEGVVRWTLDGGSTWSTDIVLTLPGNGVGWLEKVHFFNQDTGIVFNSFSGGCWYTYNGGKDVDSWTYVNINPDLGWIAGNIDAQPGGQVYATGIHFAGSIDFGWTWTSNASADNVFDGGIDFLDDNNLYGWTGGGQISAPVSGWVHRTTDGGLDWGPRLETFPYPIRAVKFFNETTGLAIGGNLYGEEGGIYSSPDGGITWNLDISTSAEMFSLDYQIISADSTDVWCVGTTGGSTGFTGKLYKTRIFNPTTHVPESSPIIPNTELLMQNVPNPFGHSTKINYRIPFSGYVSLKVFDLLGNVVATLVDRVESPGYKSVKFEPCSIPAGVYYYSLLAGSCNETKKLILQH
jgi:photosystem II stability/assembly factor-like uncharacterized protein